ncbi:Protein of unknown function, partial [Gryllus bimaculatus]
MPATQPAPPLRLRHLLPLPLPVCLLLGVALLCPLGSGAFAADGPQQMYPGVSADEYEAMQSGFASILLLQYSHSSLKNDKLHLDVVYLFKYSSQSRTLVGGQIALRQKRNSLRELEADALRRALLRDLQEQAMEEAAAVAAAVRGGGSSSREEPLPLPAGAGPGPGPMPAERLPLPLPLVRAAYGGAGPDLSKEEPPVKKMKSLCHSAYSRFVIWDENAPTDPEHHPMAELIINTLNTTNDSSLYL